MEYFSIALAVLFILAVVDLSVGVSNDAVNFLNSAIGSQVASRRTIMIVVCAGVLCGALFSSGIMQVARSGIINPELFTFADVMVVFLAVMLADVLLLDLYNTFGLPTSTTVSIVFELLGAATAVAIIHVTHNPDAPAFIEFINGQKALQIISGIGLSVGIAFAIGMVVQFFSRLLFTFEDGPRSGVMRVAWSALALTAITNFLLIKGLKGASFITADAMAYITQHSVLLSIAVLTTWLAVSLLIHRAGRNPLGFAVLAGTFSLAMAFASNDLVNFIGVPLAGLESWRAWSASGLDAEAFIMSDLANPVAGNTGYLLAAGAIMAVTLWLSSKAQSVTQTEVRLSRQDEGSERFQPGVLSRSLVIGFVKISDGVRSLTPARTRSFVESRFKRGVSATAGPNAPAFDLVRASVNLTVASILIAIATALKLPLSTTFVSFMVAMGTSLSDRAWGRDSAVYRVAGVLSVLAGWFGTAAAAFLLAALFAVILSSFGGWGLTVLVALVAFGMFRTFRFHTRRMRSEERVRTRSIPTADDRHEIQALQSQLSGLLQECSDCLDLTIQGLLGRDRKLLERAGQRMSELKDSYVRKEMYFVRMLKQSKPDVDSVLMDHMRILSCQQDLFQSVQTIVESARTHVLGEHGRLTEETQELLQQFNVSQRQLAEIQADAWSSPAEQEKVSSRLEEIRQLLTESIRSVVNDLYGGVRPVNFTTLVLTLLTELEDFARAFSRARGLWNEQDQLENSDSEPD